jgi:hypothetical protein
MIELVRCPRMVRIAQRRLHGILDHATHMQVDG